MPHDLDLVRERLSRHGVLFAGASTRPRASISDLLEIYDDDDIVAGFLDELEAEVEGQVTEAA
jgi:hypothetical protein